MEGVRTPRAAVAGRDYELVPADPPRRRRQPPTTAVWAIRPWRTRTGQRLLAYRIHTAAVEVLIAGSPPRWAQAEQLLSEHAARQWLMYGFR